MSWETSSGDTGNNQREEKTTKYFKSLKNVLTIEQRSTSAIPSPMSKPQIPKCQIKLLLSSFISSLLRSTNLWDALEPTYRALKTIKLGRGGVLGQGEGSG